MKVEGTGKVNLVLGGDDDRREREQWIREGRQRILTEIEARGGTIPGDLIDDVNDDVLN